MKSPSGKVEWLCPNCRSKNISYIKRHIHGERGECKDCYTFWPWTNRIKTKAKEL